MINGNLRLTRTDGLLHLETSAILCVVFASFLPWWGAAIATLAIGFGKELYDKERGGVASWHDIIFDVIGIALGVGLNFLP